jgi:hypothetical protein
MFRCSMVKVFQDILWAVCFVVSGDWLLSEAGHHHTGHRHTHTAPTQTHTWAQSFWYKNVAIPLICLFPLWLRFNQCLRRYLDTGKRVPNLPNAFKYAMSQTVTLFGTFHPLYLMNSGGNEGEYVSKHRFNTFQIVWMGLFISSSMYSFFWDVYMDWGLGRKEVSNKYSYFVSFDSLFCELTRDSLLSIVRISWAPFNVSQPVLLLHGHWC